MPEQQPTQQTQQTQQQPTSKDDELVACITANDFYRIMGGRLTKPGFHTTPTYLAQVVLLSQWQFLRRGDVETNPEYKQVIPYVFFDRINPVNTEYTVLAYSRSKSGGEDRLHDKYSVGFGGHINPQDVPEDIDLVDHKPDNTLWQRQTLCNAIKREIFEEIDPPNVIVNVEDLYADGYTGEMTGLIYDPTNPVGEVHIGLVFRMRAADGITMPREDSVHKLHWAPVKNVFSHPEYYRENWETWSTMLWDHIKELPELYAGG